MPNFLTGESDKPKTDIIPLPRINGIPNLPTTSTKLPVRNRDNNMGDHSNSIMHISNTSVLQVPKLDLDRLANAVSSAETGGCKKGSARVNNCFGIKRKGAFQKYKTKEASFKDFKEIWSKYYKVFPTIKEAKKWTGESDIKARIWLNNVIATYSQ